MYLYLILILLKCVFADRSAQLVSLKQGNVRGYKQAGTNFYTFYGIPYATVPFGVHKFKAPLPPPKWNETLEATNRYILCPQHPIVASLANERYNLIYTQNCLVANIYVPQWKKKKLPVMVHIHGGSFQIGYGEMMTYSPLVETGKVIVVSINYRLGVQGFLCLGTEDIPGNAGLKDQIAALRWVKDNISKFGGNPDDVTISGASAGSAAVEMLMLSAAARGLFNKIIQESGSAVSSWAVQKDPLANAKQIALSHNFTNVDNILELEKFFKTTSLDVLETFDLKKSFFEMMPCVERSTNINNSVLLDTPVNIYKSGKFNKVPMLVGFSKNEGMYRLPFFDSWSMEMNKNFSNFIPDDLTFPNNDEKSTVAKKVKKFYFANKSVDINTVQNYVDYFSDVFMKMGALKSVKLYLESGGQNVYLYEFSYVDEVQPADHGVTGSTHCAQTAVLTTRNLFINKINTSIKHKNMRDLMVELWTNFITTGNPVPYKTSLITSGWPVTSLKDPVYMDLNTTPEVKKNLRGDHMKLWDEIYEKYYIMPILGPPITSTKRREL